jgi:AcrR family transcriptional regulator
MPSPDVQGSPEHSGDHRSSDHRRGARRRGEALEHAILTAALEELSDVGYAALTMERVAARARTGKAALYRRWAGRADLVVDAWAARGMSDVDVPDTGALRSDVLAVLRHFAATVAGPSGELLRGLLGEIVRDAEFARLVRERVHTAGPGVIHSVLRRAVERGEIEPWVLGSRRATVAVDLLRNDFLLRWEPVPDEVLVEIVDEVYLPLLLAPPAGAGHGPG